MAISERVKDLLVTWEAGYGLGHDEMVDIAVALTAERKENAAASDQLAHAVVAMRRLQREYFDHKRRRPETLQEAKAAERAVDDMLASMGHPVSPGEERQPGLFG